MVTPIFLYINRAEIGAWRASRIFAACRSFAQTIAPHCDIQAVYVSHERTGWTFSMPTEGARDALLAYHDTIMRVPT